MHNKNHFMITEVFGKKFIPALIVVFLILASCSYNPSIFNVTQQGELMPDTTQFEKIYLRNNTGKELYGCLFKPAGEVRGTVFLLTSNSGDIALWYDVTSIMIKNGFQVLSFDYQGIGKSNGEPDYNNALEDSQLYLDMMKSREDVKGTKIIFWGFGLGADLAVKLAFDNPNTADYLVLDSPYTSKRAITIHTTPWYLKPFVYPFVYSGFSAKNLLPQISDTPILIVHSTEDQVVPYKMGEQLFQIANPPKLFFESLGPHGYSLIDHEDLYMERIEKLWTY